MSGNERWHILVIGLVYGVVLSMTAITLFSIFAKVRWVAVGY